MKFLLPAEKISAVINMPANTIIIFKIREDDSNVG